MLSITSLGWDDDPRVLRLLRNCSLEVRFLQYSLIISFWKNTPTKVVISREALPLKDLIKHWWLQVWYSASGGGQVYRVYTTYFLWIVTWNSTMQRKEKNLNCAVLKVMSYSYIVKYCYSLLYLWKYRFKKKKYFLIILIFITRLYGKIQQNRRCFYTFWHLEHSENLLQFFA